jgi:predicted secreted hydrolase
MRLLSLFLLLLLLTACESQTGSQTRDTPVRVDQRMGGSPDPGFKRATAPRAFEFPRDHGAHPEFATEWWYFTGNLQSDQGQAFGYQFTLFRVGLKPGKPEPDSQWRAHQVYMGHLALSDIDAAEHLSAERFSRAAAGLAGASLQPVRIWLGPWVIQGGGQDLFPLKLRAAAEAFSIDMTIERGGSPLVLQGEQGLSQKGPEPGNASYYYSMTRLPTSGKVQVDDHSFDVEGYSWFDREWSSSALSKDQAGWDWFALQLDDGRDLMFYQMRDKQGKAQSYSRGVLVESSGRVHELSLENTQLEALRSWKNADGVEYPIQWSLVIPEYAIDLVIEAAFDDQEMRHTVHYWEGAVRVTGSHKGKGYLELSGYVP